MEQLFIFIIGVVIGVVVVWVLVKRPPGASEDKENFKEKQKREKEQGKQKVLQSIEMQKSITNDAVQNLLGVSDATATRYLDELEKEGKIKQVGAMGGYVYYEKIE